MAPQFRATERLTLTLPWSVLERLRQLALVEGRSVSNLCAHLLESALRVRDEKPQ